MNQPHATVAQTLTNEQTFAYYKTYFYKTGFNNKGEAENLEQSKQIHLTTTIMKTQDLNEQELIEINGGGLLNILGLNLLGGLGGNSGTGTSQSGLTGGLSIGNLLSITSTNSSGTTTSISLGNNIVLSLQQLTNSIFG